MKIISVSQNEANPVEKVTKSQSVIAKRGKSKSSVQIIRQHQVRFNFKGLLKKEETEEVKNEIKPTLLKRRFKKKSKIQMIEDIYNRKDNL